MNYKKKNLILSIILIIGIQILLLINNSQKTSFRYFIWNIQNISIGRLISISFFSGLFISTILNKTLNSNVRKYTLNKEKDETSDKNDYTINNENDNESTEIPPERDLRDPQPTISVNYRVIKDNSENDVNDRYQRTKGPEYQDDWSNEDSDWQ